MWNLWYDVQKKKTKKAKNSFYVILLLYNIINSLIFTRQIEKLTEDALESYFVITLLTA